MGASDTGKDTEFTVSKKRIKQKGPKGKEIYKKGTEDYGQIKTVLQNSGKDKIINKK